MAIVLILWHWGLRNRMEPFYAIVDKQWPVVVKTMENLHVDISHKAVSPAALCKGRQGVGTAPFVALHAMANEKHLREHHRLTVFKGYRLWAVDGSSLNLPSNKNLENVFGRPASTGKHRASPQASFVALELVYTGWIIEFRIARCDASELALSKEVTAVLGAGDLLLADRLYFDPAWYADLCRREVKFLFRLNCNRHESLTPESQLKINNLRLKGNVDCRVDLRVKTANGNYELLKDLRYIECKRSGADTLYLITTLNEEEVSLAEAVELYRMRWEIETNFRFFKGQNHLPVVRSKKEDTVRQEVILHVLGHNSVRFIQAEACLAEANTRASAPPDTAGTPEPPPPATPPTTADSRHTPKRSTTWTAKHTLHSGLLRPVDLQFNRTVETVLGFIIAELLLPDSPLAWALLLEKVAGLKIMAKQGRSYPRVGRKYNKGKRQKGNVKAQRRRSQSRKKRGKGES